MNWFRRRPTTVDAFQPKEQLATYAEWSLWFEAFERGGDDDSLLARADAATTDLSGGLADNFARRASETLNLRLDEVGTMLQAGLRRIQSERDAVRAILNARGAFVLLRRYAELHCWPESLRSGLTELVDHHMAERQGHLMRNAAEDRSGRLATAIRNTPLDRPGLAPNRPIVVEHSHDTPSGPQPRRLLLS